MVNVDKPIWSPEAEKSAIGSMILSEARADELLAKLRTEHFLSSSCRALFAAIQELRSSGSGVDLVTLRDKLTKLGTLEAVGGQDALIDIAEYVPSPANATHYADIILGKWKRREILAIAEKAKDEDVSLDEIQFRLESLRGVGSPHSPRSGPIGSFIGQDRKKGVATGMQLVDLNTVTFGAPCGQYSVITAGTGVGKTNTMLEFAYHAANHGEKVLFVTLADMSAGDLADRLCKQITGWSYRPPDTHKEDQGNWDWKVEDIKDIPLIVHDLTDIETGDDVETIAAFITAEKDNNGYTVVFIDYAQEMTTARRGLNSLEVADRCSRVIKKLAQRLEIPIWIGSQVTQKDGVDYTKGSRVWEERSALNLALHKFTEDEIPKLDSAYKGIPGIGKAKLKKNRFGKQGISWWVAWDQNTNKMTEL